MENTDSEENSVDYSNTSFSQNTSEKPKSKQKILNQDSSNIKT